MHTLPPAPWSRCGARGEAVPVAELQALISTCWSTVTTELDCSGGDDEGPGLSRQECIAWTSQPNLEAPEHPAGTAGMSTGPCCPGCWTCSPPRSGHC